MTKDSILSAGLDISKVHIDAALAPRDGSGPHHTRFANDPPGRAALVAWLKRHGVDRVGMEATGGYERPVADALRAKHVAVVLFQPKQIRAFAEYRNRRAKNDRLDAELIALCTAAVETVRPPPDARLAEMARDLLLIEQLEGDIARLKTRLEAYRDAPRQTALLNEQITYLKALKSRELRRLRAEIRKQADLSQRLALIESVEGVGPRTALAVLIHMPEIGALSREQAAALAGLAPYDADSGFKHGKRCIKGGRDKLRLALFKAALPASFRWNPGLVSLYKRLTDAGKPHRVALIACARKMLIYINTVVARGEPWTPAEKPV